MKNPIMIISICAVLFTGCGQNSSNSNTQANTTNTTNAANSAAAKATPKVDPNTQAIFPFKDFPAFETKAKAGEVVLVPSYNWLQEATVNGAEKTTMIWYQQTMITPDKEMSEIKFMSDSRKVPNAYIVAIPTGQKAKNGDVLLTWWQSGSGLQRAFVTYASNPDEPIVRYLDLDYDNPAKAKDGKTGIGQMEEKLKPNSFVKINAPFESGSVVAIQDGADFKHGQVINTAGDKVFVSMFAGRIAVYDKSRCQGVPIIPNVKAGDKVKAERSGSFRSATVNKVDEKIGRVFVKFDDGDKEKEYAIAFGDVMK